MCSAHGKNPVKEYELLDNGPLAVKEERVLLTSFTLLAI